MRVRFKVFRSCEKFKPSLARQHRRRHRADCNGSYAAANAAAIISFEACAGALAAAMSAAAAELSGRVI
jgi:hypothetical protein